MDLKNEWYSIKETSNMTGLSVGIIQRDIRDGLIVNTKMHGKKILINKEEVLSLIDLTKNYYTTTQVKEIMNKSSTFILNMVSTQAITAKRRRGAFYLEKNKVHEIAEFLKNTITIAEFKRKYRSFPEFVRYLIDEKLVEFMEINNKLYIDTISLDNTFEKIKENFYLSDVSDISLGHLKFFKKGYKGKSIEMASKEMGMDYDTLLNKTIRGQILAYRDSSTSMVIIPQEEIDKFCKGIDSIKQKYYATDKVYDMHSELMEYLIQSTDCATETLKEFREWSMNNLTKSKATIDYKRRLSTQYISIATVLSENLQNEIWECEEGEILNLIKEIKQITYQETLSRFYSYIQSIKDCKSGEFGYIAKIDKNKSDLDESKEDRKYSVEEWLMIKDYLVDLNKHIKKAKANVKYAQCWLFAILHLSLAWRNNDFLQINAMPVKEILNCEDIEKFDFFNITDTQAQQIINLFRTTCIPVVAHKNGVETHMIFPPQLIKATAVAICISEIHRLKSSKFNDRKGKLIMYKSMKNSDVHKTIFPNDYPKFESLKCNRSKQTYSFVTAANTTGRGHIAYSLTGYSRSHKPKVVGANESTTAYLELINTSVDAKSIGKHLFERGVFGWQVELMIGVLEEYSQDSLEQRTKRIKELTNRYSPSVTESISNYLTIEADEINKLVDELMTMSEDEIRKKLIEIGELKSPAFLNYTQCMKGTSNCKYLEGKAKCLGCRYNIPTNYVLEIVNERLNETLDLIDNTPKTDEVKLIKYSHIIRQLMFIMMDFRRSTKEYFEDDYLTSFIDLKSIGYRLAMLEQKGKILRLEGE